MQNWKIWLCTAALAFGLPGASDEAQAQSFPSRAITLVIPFAPGGSTSIVGRVIADKMSELIGEKVVVDNRPGAGGTVGTKAVAKSEPDGYTLVLGYTGTLAIGPSLYKNVGYDPRKDFAPIGMIGNAPNSLVVNPSFPAMTDLLGGHIPMAFAPIPASHANIAAGTLRGLAVTSTTRSSLLPEVPTIAESALPGFDASLYYGLAAPAGTPRPVIDRLNKTLQAALASDEVKRQLTQDGTEITPGTPEDYAAFIDKDEKKWAQLVKASGVEQE